MVSFIIIVIIIIIIVIIIIIIIIIIILSEALRTQSLGSNISSCRRLFSQSIKKMI